MRKPDRQQLQFNQQKSHFNQIVFEFEFLFCIAVTFATYLKLYDAIRKKRNCFNEPGLTGFYRSKRCQEIPE